MAYDRINFINYPNTSTPLDADNLNKMDSELKYLDDNSFETESWNNSTSYTAGKVVIHNNKLWKALVTNSNTEPSGATSLVWQPVSINQLYDDIAKQGDKFATVKGKVLNTSENFYVDLPNGFTVNNCVVLSVMAKSTDGTLIAYIPYGDSTQYNVAFFVSRNQIRYSTRNTVYVNSDWIFTLMRTDI